MKKNIKRFLPILMLVLVLIPKTPVKALGIKAPAGILMDAKTGEVLYEKNSHSPRAMASTSKLMTYLLTMDAVDRGQVALTDRVRVSKRAASEGGSSYNLKEGDVLTVSELVNSLMMISANDSAVVLAEHVSGSQSAFVREMNEKARALNLTSASFVNPNGMPLKDNNQNKISARDLALLTKHTLDKHGNHLINITRQKDFYGTYKSFSKRNTNQLLRNTDFTDGLKTGYTRLARHCLISTAGVNNPAKDRVIAVVLGGNTSQERYADSLKMLEYGLAYFGQGESLPSDISVFIEGIELSCGQAQPYIKEGTTLVPLAKIGNKLGGSIFWDAASKSVYGQNEAGNFKLTIGEKKALVNGKEVELLTPPEILNGSTMVPIKFVGESLGQKVSWNSQAKRVEISKEALLAEGA